MDAVKPPLAAVALLPHHVTSTPKIVNTTLDEDDWTEMAEVAPR